MVSEQIPRFGEAFQVTGRKHGVPLGLAEAKNLGLPGAVSRDRGDVDLTQHPARPVIDAAAADLPWVTAQRVGCRVPTGPVTADSLEVRPDDFTCEGLPHPPPYFCPASWPFQVAPGRPHD